MRFLLRLIAYFVVFSVVLSAVRRIGRVIAPGRPDGGQLRPAHGGRLVKDPVCGTYIPAETAVQARGQFFCSEECRSKYV